MCLVSFVYDTIQSFVVRKTEPAKFGATAACILSTRHVIAAPRFLDSMITLRATLEIGTLQCL